MMEYQERGNYSVVYSRDLLSRGFILLECSAEFGVLHMCEETSSHWKEVSGEICRGPREMG